MTRVRSKKLSPVSETPHPLRFIRPTRLAKLLGVNYVTIWRWSQDGTLPPAVHIGSLHGWFEPDLQKWRDALKEASA